MHLSLNSGSDHARSRLTIPNLRGWRNRNFFDDRLIVTPQSR
jgi:hypothetical protein